MWRKYATRQNITHITLIAVSLIAIFTGGIFLWASRLTIPTIESFNERRIGQSTKIYDRTGTIVLYDLNQNTRRTVIRSEEIPEVVKDAAVAIEDDTFYEHSGIRPIAFLRAALVNLTTLEFSQGGSTITQQVVKNSLLSQEKKITRKIKEWFLAINLERLMTKDEILTIYLNESPYGSNIYGVEEASQAFFGKHAIELSLAEAAYIAAIPQAPTYFSPYGTHKEQLEARKNLVLKKMNEQGKITNEEFEQAKNTEVEFKEQAFVSIKAPHFVMYVKEELEEKYGAEDLATRGLSIVTTLNYELQQKAEEVVKEYALKNAKDIDAENAGLVVVDPKTGDILTMVGSRDYFDPDIDGNYNIATALRQPGSTFKPFVYSVAFMKGYQPETVVFDVPTEFSTSCNVDGTPIGDSECYKPVNYDGVYAGPISLRNALAQSKNIPAVKTLYLAGIQDSIRFARSMGLTTLKQNGDYGLTLVLGGGEIRLLDLTSAYGVFANEGVRNAPRAILSIAEASGNKEDAPPLEPTRVLDENIALKITDVLTDNNARTPAFGANSPLYIPGGLVAAKTGTTDDYRDTWIVGYSTDMAVGAWAGNNDNRPIDRRVAGYVIAPMWRAFMNEALKISTSSVPFKKPIPDTQEITKPIILGRWQPQENGTNAVHDILHFVDRRDPLGPAPANPAQDGQYDRWEYGVQNWVLQQFGLQQTTGNSSLNGIFGTSTMMLPPGAIIAPNQDMSSMNFFLPPQQNTGQ